MPVPDFQSLMRPLLVLAQSGGEQSARGAVAALADNFDLSKEDREKRNASGNQSVLYNRTHWAITYLAKAGALQRTGRGRFVITERGRALLAEHPDRVDLRMLRKFPEFESFRTTQRVTGDSALEPAEAEDDATSVARTPEEMIDAAFSDIDIALRASLLEKIFELPSEFFERLVVDLIVAMGFGGDRGSVARRLGRSGDEGIDGVVNEDPLGLDVVYVQAKRYAPEHSIGRERSSSSLEPWSVRAPTRVFSSRQAPSQGARSTTLTAYLSGLSF